MPAASLLLTRQLSLVGSTATTVLLLVVALAALGVAMSAVTVWLVRATRTDHVVLGPLEVMGDRSFRRATEESRASRLGAARPSGAPPPAPIVAVDEAPQAEADQPAAVVGDDGSVPATGDSPSVALEGPAVEEPATVPDGEAPVEEPATVPGDDAPVEEPAIVLIDEAPSEEPAAVLAAGAPAPPLVESPAIDEGLRVDESGAADGAATVEAPRMEEVGDRPAGPELPPPAPDESPVTPPFGTPVTPPAPVASGGDGLR
ncbi:MAG: hypothetical protein ACR2HP_06805 [Ilumatobacteraceae bacterium]